MLTNEQIAAIRTRWADHDLWVRAMGVRPGDEVLATAAEIASIFMDLAALLGEVDRLREDCAQAYQVVGAMGTSDGHEGYRFDSNSVQRALDNLGAAADGEPRPHEDLLPWPDESKLPREAVRDRAILP